MELFPPQKELINKGYIESTKHYMLNMSTGTGKTFLAELAIEKILKEGYKAVYITPLRAIAAQIHFKWVKRFCSKKVCVFTGETTNSAKSSQAYERADILIMTPERFDACLRNWRSHWSWIPDVSIVVVDEFHILGQGNRGSRLEGSITRMLRINPFVRFINLSATMPNYLELASWLHGESFHSSWRQIEIKKKVEYFSSAKNKPEIAIAHVKSCLSEYGQSIIFCNSRTRVQHLADYLAANNIKATTHHAGLTKEIRHEHEEGFKTGKYQVMVATSTVEMGLNFPARQVIIYDAYHYSDSGFKNLPVWSFIQRMGRAGRPGLDTAGECILLLPKWAGNADRYLMEQCEAVNSQLVNKKALIEQILIEVYAGYSRTRSELVDGFLPFTLLKQQHKEININGIINQLILHNLLVEKEDDRKDNAQREKLLRVTLLGRMSVRLMIAPETVTLIKSFKSAFNRPFIFDILLLACMNEDCSPIINADYEELDTLWDNIQALPSEMLNLSLDKYNKILLNAPHPLRLLAALKMATICYLLTEGYDYEKLAHLFDVYEPDIQMLQENVVRMLNNIAAVSSALDKAEISPDKLEKQKRNHYALTNIANMLTNMLLYGINSELVALTQLKGVGGATAKKLAAGGYTNIESLKLITPEDLHSKTHIGLKLSISIVEQIKTNGIEFYPTYTEEQKSFAFSKKEVNTSIDPYRLKRSLELKLKGKDGSCFLVTGGSDDHVVYIKDKQYKCDCMDFAKNTTDCKHILCVKRITGDVETNKLIKKIKENKSQSIRDALPTLWYATSPKE